MKTLKEIWSAQSSNIDNLRIFGCVAYDHTRQGKRDAYGIKCMLISYPKCAKGYGL